MDDPYLLEPIGGTASAQVHRERAALRAHSALQPETEERRVLDELRLAVSDLPPRDTPLEAGGRGVHADAQQVPQVEGRLRCSRKGADEAQCDDCTQGQSLEH